MAKKSYLVLIIYIASYLQVTYGQCQIGGGLQLGAVPNLEVIKDIHRGIIRSEATTNIQGIVSIIYGGALVGSNSYLDITLENSQFVIQTSSAFAQYEEYETALSIYVTITLSCTGGNSTPMLFLIDIQDTNNNYPEFRPTNAFEFVVAPPLPPGFLLTGCLSEITVRDIDLTTSRIIFEIEDNPYFEIEYNEVASTAAGAKEFKAQLKTSAFIRTLSEPITLEIKATDVDLTGDPSLSTTGTIRISGDTEFEFPDEPVFSQTTYFATYTDDHQIIHLDTISLQQGFDELVEFSLDGEHKSYFTEQTDGNQVSLVVRTPLPIDVLLEKQVYLVVRADREYTSGDSATIVINLPEETPLLFENALYKGSIVDNTLQLPPLVLSQGYESVTVSARVVGEHASSFTAIVQGNLVTITMDPLTDDVIGVNTFISMPVLASTHSSEATTIVSLGIIKDDIVTPVFDKSIYYGSYDPVNGLSVEQIVIVQGFDETLSVELHGDHKDFFQVNAYESVIRLTSSTIPPELFEEQRITLSIEASKPRTVGANAVVIITLPAARQLDFEEPTYRGTIENNELFLQTILLRDGYDPNVRFIHSGEYSTYFEVTNVQNQVTITLLNPLPESVITQNSIIMLTLTASGLNAISTTTSILLDIIKEDTVTPVLNKNIYYGTYSGPSNFEIENIYLTQGYDDGVSFKLDDSAHAQYFEISNVGNFVTIRLRSAIPADVIFNEKVLLFNVLADKALTVGSNAAVLIRFPTELTESTVMSFSQNYYVGVFEQNEITFSENIILDTGYDIGTEFVLIGEYADIFELSNTNNVVHITTNRINILLLEDIKDDFITLTVEAKRERAISVRSTIIVDIVKEEVLVITPVFDQAYYRGLYTEEDVLQFDENIYISEGYDETVTFHLEGEHAAWFSLISEGNSASLVLDSPIPKIVLKENNQLIFTIVALKTNGVNGRAVVSIDLPNGNIRFSQEAYNGFIEEGIPVVEVMSIHDFYIPSDVTPTLLGDYSDYFQIRNEDGNLILELGQPIPNEILEEHNVLILTLAIQIGNNRISTVIVLEVIRTETDIFELTFEKPYYVGSYDELTGFEFNDVIRISDINIDGVSFDLSGIDAQWFDLIEEDNSVNLTLKDSIPNTVLLTHHQLIFEIIADRPGSRTARSTIVVSILSDSSDISILGFDQVTYRGSIENDQATVAPITLSEGYVTSVEFTLHGDLYDYFAINSDGPTVTVTLRNPIPEELIPTDRTILLVIQASAPQTMPAHASLVITYIVDETTVVELIFAQTFYTGTYTDTAGLTFTTPISLTDGYDADVQFILEGDAAQWFRLSDTGNSQTLVLSSPIPASVLANNQQLIFVVAAQRSGSTTSRATIVISLTVEYTEGLLLGFDQVTYRGSIENNQATVAPITLSQGYVPDVEFTLHGDLFDYFAINSDGPTVTVTLRNPIPEELIPTDRTILLVIQASAPQTMPAHASLVITYIVDETTVVELIFAQTFYTGTYTDTAGLTFTTPISLTHGYDADVQFILEGDAAQWFRLSDTGNSQTLVLSSPIPASVLANNQQLIFVVAAQRSGSTTSRATIVISLTAEYTEGLLLGFDQVTYRGSIENNQATVAPITLSQGYVPGVEFTLHGDLYDYFAINSDGPTVTVTLRNPIPEELIPTDRTILLVIQASAPQTMPAHASLVITYIVDETTVVELIFAQTFYTGTYTDTAGLTFTTPISLTHGYDADVQFILEGDAAQWFRLSDTGNSQTLVLSSPIPASVLANNQQLIFVVAAQRSGSTTSRATIVISLTVEYTEGLLLGFDQVTYRGSIENNQATITQITLSEGYVPGVEFTLHGDLFDYFAINSDGPTVTVTLRNPIPEELIPTDRTILLVIQASAPQTIPAHASLVITYIIDETTVVELIFAQTFYTGTYTDTAGLTFTTPISLTHGYDADVQFILEGDAAQWFRLSDTGNSQTLVLSSPIPASVLANNQQLIFVVAAQRSGSTTSRATIVISLTAEYTEGLLLGFDQVTYRGSIENNQATVAPITLSQGYVPGVEFTLHGDLYDYFAINSDGPTVTVTLRNPIPEELIPTDRTILLVIQASAPQTMPAHASLVITYIVDETTVVELIFAQTFYTGTYTDTAGLTFTTPISLTHGYDADVQFILEGDAAQWFRLSDTGNSQTLVLSSPIPASVLANNQQLIFVVAAQRSGSTTSRATIVISLTAEYTEDLLLGFDQVTYRGSIENNQATVAPITLSQGYVPGVEFTLHGDLYDYFAINSDGPTVTVTLRNPIPEELIPTDRTILLVIQASAPQTMPAHASLVITYIVDETTVVELIFAQTFYTGTYTDTAGLTFTTPISLTHGYDADVQFILEGDAAQWFRLSDTGNSQTLVLSSPIPASVLANNQQLIFVVAAQRSGSTTSRATIVISIIAGDSQTGSEVSFQKVLYEGVLQNGVVSHETITVFGYDETRVEVSGVYASLFEAVVVDGEVTVRVAGSLTLPADITHLVLELQAGTARAVLVLEVSQSDVPTPTLPVVTFNSASYAVRVEITDTGLIGQVEASADNGEAVRYSLQLTNGHLQERLSISDVGELHLSAPVNSGVYTFQVVAITIFTQVTGTATVYLSAEAITVCGDEIVMPPLIVLDRDEEEPHYNLINSNDGCHFEISNRYPMDQTWLYVNETGLHTTAIDREHESIAFMTLSQVQVEIILHCESDAENRVKRSLDSKTSDPYDYGSSRWIITDTILYNSRRSLVNLIVNDINDNAPVFVGKDQEPIAVGYPVAELEERVLPRSLAELQATDADIGENAELLYWSSEPALAVAPLTGFVHIRDGSILENDARMTVHATDRNGQGLTGSLDIVVKLLKEDSIIVVTVRDAFLDNELNVVTRLSESVGYEIKVLRSAVIPDDENNEEPTRNNRETNTTGASLQLYVYGLIDREPVSVERLITDITNADVAQVNIASTISLDDHLAGQEICVVPGRDTGLLAATIVLSVLLFIVMVLIAVWFFLRWRRKQNYDQFSDASSLASRAESVDQTPKPMEVATKPRLNLEELKKSERRLQEMLDAPIQEVTVEPTSSRKDAILDIPSSSDSKIPIVIQSTDKLKDAAEESSDDEFGERKSPKRKSVVTFNEIVEKIIHVEDSNAGDTSPGFEVYRL